MTHGADPGPQGRSGRRRAPLFLARAEYRRRRLRDAARLLPVVGALLFLLPVLWQGQAETPGTARGGAYLFGIWAVLILGCAALAPALARRTPDDAPVAAEPESDRNAL